MQSGCGIRGGVRFVGGNSTCLFSKTLKVAIVRATNFPDVRRVKVFATNRASLNHDLTFQVMFNAVVFFGDFGVVPAGCSADEIQNVIVELFISTSASRLAVQHNYSRSAVAWRGLVAILFQSLCVAPDYC